MVTCDTMQAPRGSDHTDHGARGRWSRFFLRLVLGCALIAAICWSSNFKEVFTTLRGARPGLVLTACVLAFADRCLMACKWNLLLRCRNVPVPFATAVRVQYVGYVLGVFTPGGLGAEAYRIYALRRFGPIRIIAASMVMERLIGLAVVGIVAVVTLPVSALYIRGGSSQVLYAIGAVAVASVAAFWASLYPPIVRRLGRWVPFLSTSRLGARIRVFYEAYAEYRNHPRTLVLFVMLTSLELFMLIMLNFVATRALGLDVSLTYYLCVMPLLHILVRLPISFQGLGVQEGLFAYFLLIAGYSVSQGLSVSLLHRALEIICVILPGGILLVLQPGRSAAVGGPKAVPSAFDRPR